MPTTSCPLRQQAVDEVRADEAGGPGDDDLRATRDVHDQNSPHSPGAHAATVTPHSGTLGHILANASNGSLIVGGPSAGSREQAGGGDERGTDHRTCDQVVTPTRPQLRHPRQTEHA